MTEQQRNIAVWLRDVMERRSISARAWAERAGVGKDTVSRALREDYGNITSTRTLTRLAEAVGERAPTVASVLPSEEILTQVLEIVLNASKVPPLTDDMFKLTVRALREVLAHLADDPEAASDVHQARAVARTVCRNL